MRELSQELVDCPRCDGGRKHGQRRQPYSFKRLTKCIGDCYLCCDMHKIPRDLAGAYLLSLPPQETAGRGISVITVTIQLKRDFFGGIDVK